MSFRLLLASVIFFTVFSCKSPDPTPDEPDTAETVYVGNFSGYLHAFDATSGTKKWEATIDGPVNFSPTVASGVVYIGSQAKLYAFEAITGTKKWEVKLGNEFQTDNIRSYPTVVNGSVYVCVEGFTSRLYAVDAMTGVIKWEFSPGGFNIASPTVNNGIIYIGFTGKLYALDAVTGTKKWEVLNLLFTPTNPSVVDGVIYTNCGKLYAHDALTGVQKWVSDVVCTGSPTVENGLIFLKESVSGSLNVISATTGNYLRGYRFAWEGNSNPIAINGIVYVGSGSARDYSGDGMFTVHAVDALTATKKWTQKVEFPTNASPTVAAGTVFLGTLGTASKLYAMDALTGDVKWGVSATQFINNYTSACVVTKKGVVYHPSDSGDQQ